MKTPNEWVPRFFVMPIVEPAEPDQSPLDYVPHTLADQDRQPGSITVMHPPVTEVIPSDEVALFRWERDLVRTLETQSVWRRPQHRRQYPARQGIKAKRRKFGCRSYPSGCYAGYLASLYDDLPWTPSGYMVTFTAPPGRFLEWWNRWTGLETWDRSTARRRLEHQVFYLLTFAWQPGTREPHVTLLVGNISRDLLYQEVRAWPGQWDLQRIGVGRKTVWGAIHYAIGGQAVRPKTKDDPLPRQHAEDLFSYCHALCDVPRYSANFQVLLTLTNRRVERTRRAKLAAAGAQSGAGQSADWRIERAKKGAAEKWRRYYAKQANQT